MRAGFATLIRIRPFSLKLLAKSVGFPVQVVDMPNYTAEERLEASLKRSSEAVFLRREFYGFGGYAQVGRALRVLRAKGLLVKVGHGLYVKARPSTLSGKPVPCLDLMSIGFQTMRKLGIQADYGKAMRDLRDGLSTQVPMTAVINTGKSRVRRKITVGKRTIQYERRMEDSS